MRKCKSSLISEKLVVVLPKFSLFPRAVGCHGGLLRKFTQDCKVAVNNLHLALLDVERFELRKRIGPEFFTEAALEIGKFNKRYRRAR